MLTNTVQTVLLLPASHKWFLQLNRWCYAHFTYTHCSSYLLVCNTAWFVYQHIVSIAYKRLTLFYDELFDYDCF